MPTPDTSPATNVTAQKATMQAQYEKLIDGIVKDLPDLDKITFQNQVILRADLLKRLQDRVDAANATRTTKVASRLAVENERAVAQSVDPLRAALKRYLQIRYGFRSSKLQDFGFTPPKTPKKTALAKQTGVTKAKATRVARGTKGPKQRKLIKGAAPAVPAAPSGGSSPAQGASPATTSAQPAAGVAGATKS